MLHPPAKKLIFLLASLFVIVFFVFLSPSALAANTGVYTSEVIDFGFPAEFTTLTWQQSNFASTSITIEVRASNTPALSGVWTEIINSGDSLAAINNNRYAQYKITLSSEDDSVEPYLSEINFNYHAIGTLISSIYDTGVSDNVLSGINWLEGGLGSTEVAFQIRTSTNGLAWSDWLGPNSDWDYYRDPSGSESINPVHRDGVDDRYVQIKYFLKSDGTNTTILEELNLNYDSALPTVSSIDIPIITDIYEYELYRITISGSNFSSGAIPKLSLGELIISAASSTYINATTLLAEFDLSAVSAGQYDLVVINNNKGKDVLHNALTIEQAAGRFLSQVFDTNSYFGFNTISWEATTTASSSVTMEVRSGPNIAPDGTWTSWTTVSNGASLVGITDNRYVQYRSTLKSDDFLNIPELGEVTLSYFAYSQGSLVSSAFDTDAPGNYIANVSWTERLAAGTDVTLQIRSGTSSANILNSSWRGPDGSTSPYFNYTAPQCTKTLDTVNCSINIGSALNDGSNDQWIQYRVILDSDGFNTPALENIEIVYVNNNAPEVQNIIATQNADGTVSISYDVRDSDTNDSFNLSPGFITPSFQYYNGSTWSTCTTMTADADSPKAVQEVAFTTYTTTWYPKTDFNNRFLNNTGQIRITVNDGEAANYSDTDTSNTFILDTVNPINPGIVINASTQYEDQSTSSVLTLSITDNTMSSGVSGFMEIYEHVAGVQENFTNAWVQYTTTARLQISDDTVPANIRVRFMDAKGNISSTAQVTISKRPQALITQDTSIATGTTPVWQLFVAWETAELPAQGSFGHYSILRATSNGVEIPTEDMYTEIMQISDRSINSYTDGSTIKDQLYFYKITNRDTLGNISYRSNPLTGRANGVTDAGEGGGGADVIGPEISNVQIPPNEIYTSQLTVTWETNEYADSMVYYAATSTNPGTNPALYDGYAFIPTYVNTNHRVVVADLLPSTLYHLLIRSADPTGNETFDDNSGVGYFALTTPGPIISAVALNNASNNEATISWLTDLSANSYVYYSTSSDMSVNVSIAGNATPVSSPQGGFFHHSITLKNLEQGERYFYYVKSEDPSLNAAIDNNQGNYYFFNTTQDFAVPILSAQSAITNTYTALITWKTDELSDSFLDFGTTTSYGFTASSSDDTILHYIWLDGLEYQTLYHYRISSTDVNGNTATDIERSFTTTKEIDVTPPTITDIATSSLFSNQTKITWNTDEIATSRVEYDIDTSYGENVNVSQYTNNHEITIGNLIPETTYYFRVVSSDFSGNDQTDNNYGNGYTFTTTPGPVILGTTIGSVLNEKASVTFDTDVVSTGRVAYSTSANMASPVIESNQGITTTHTVNLTGLSQYYTLYYFYVEAIDSDGNIARDDNNGKFYNFSTGNDFTGPTIGNVNALSLTNSIAVIWDTDELASSMVEYGETTAYGNSINDNTLTIQHAAFLPDIGFTNNQTYYYRVRSQDPNGNETIGDGRSFVFVNTDDPNPPIISSTTVFSVTDQTATITWITDEPADTLTHYGLSTSTLEFISGDITTMATSHVAIIPNLSASTTYSFKVSSRDSTGNISYDDNNGSYYNFTTLNDDNDAPVLSNIEIKNITQTGASVSWETNEPATARMTYGTSESNLDQEYTIDTLNYFSSIVMTGLSSDTVYYYKLFSMDTSNNTGSSLTESFRTLADVTEEEPVVSGGGGGVIIINKTDITPPVFYDLQIESLRSDSAIITWKSDEDSDSFIEYGENLDYGNLYGNAYLNTSEHRVVLDNLKPNTEYHYRATGKDSWGNLGMSENKNFTTLPHNNSDTELVNDEIKQIDDLNFNEIDNLAKNSQEDDDIRFLSKKTADLLKLNAASLGNEELEKLLAAQYDSIKDASQYLTDPVIIGTPKVVVTANSATIAWETDRESNSLVAYADKANFDKDHSNPYLQITGDSEEQTFVHVVSLYNLTPETEYHFKTMSKTKLNASIESPDLVFTTQKSILEISSYSIDQISTEEVIFQWVTNTESETKISVTPYRDNVLSVAEMIVEENNSMSVIHEIKMKGFESGVTYSILLESKNEEGQIASSRIDTFQTAKDNLAPVISQVQTNSSLSPGKNLKVQVIISWLTNEPATTRVYYEEGYGSIEDEIKNKTELQMSYSKKHVVVITEFEPGKIYRFIVESIDSGGNVSLSKTYTILTARKQESIFEVILKNFENMFSWVNKIKK